MKAGLVGVLLHSVWFPTLDKLCGWLMLGSLGCQIPQICVNTLTVSFNVPPLLKLQISITSSRVGNCWKYLEHEGNLGCEVKNYCSDLVTLLGLDSESRM